MAEKKKIIKKTINRTGKSLIKKALVVKAKKQSNIKTENIKKLNEKIKAQKEELVKKQANLEVILETKKTEDIKIDKKYNLTVGLKDLLAAGSHLGHKISKTHPKSRDYIFGKRDGIEVIDLVKTLDSLDKACNFIYNSRRNGKKIALIGTKRQAREVVKRVAIDAGVAYVTDRWLGGTITNWDQIKKNIKKLNDLRDGIEKGKFSENSKKELSDLNKEILRLDRIVGGLTKLDKLFDILFLVDAGYEKTAINEANIKNIKTIALVDTDANPFKVDFPIVANDDSLKSVTLVVEEIGRAIKAAGTN
ncbi:MAG: 30S ribosomal protein S2 [Candidatus Shapirobacteria bacterium]|nr:30S ribosomal protein S2 [Candidatus Shapirobacteria bacterium]